MALKPLNSVGGFSVGEIPANVILANSDIFSNRITVNAFANLGGIANVYIGGGSNGQVLQTDGSGNLSWTSSANVNQIHNGNSNVTIPTVNGNVYINSNSGVDQQWNFTTTGNTFFPATGTANLGNLVTANFANFTNDVVVQGNIANANNISITNNLQGNTANFSGNLVSLNANLGNLVTANFANFTNDLVVQGNIANANNISITNNLDGNTANFSGNITSLNANLGNLITANYGNFTNNLVVQGDIANANNVNVTNTLTTYNANVGFDLNVNNNSYVQGTSTANFFYANYDANINGNLVVGTDANITGNVTAGNVDGGNLVKANNFSTNGTGGDVTLTGGNIQGANVVIANSFTSNGGVVNFSTNNANVQLGNVGNVHILGGSDGYVLQTDGSGNLSWTEAPNINEIHNENSNVSIPAANGSVYINANAGTDYNWNFSIDGNLILPDTGVLWNNGGLTTLQAGTDGAQIGSFNGQSYVIANANGTFMQTLADTTNSILSFDNAGNLSIPALGSANLGNFVTANYANFRNDVVVQGNIANANNISVTNNITAGSGNITNDLDVGGNIVTGTGSGGNISGVNYLFANVANISNVVNTGAIANGTSNIRIDQNGDITISSNNLSNVYTFTYQGANVVGYVQANGIISAGGFEGSNLVSNVGILSLQAQQTGGNYNINLLVGGNGNVDVGATYITSVKDPVNPQDAATKYYVDLVAQGLHVHAPANLATNTTLANTLGIPAGNVVYNQPGPEGVGATLTFTGNSLTLLDSVAVTANMRLLIKNEANAVWNGVYFIGTNAFFITRTTDEDQNADFAGGDFLFVESGTQYADTGWVQTTDNVVIGTSNIVFSQFSGAGSYYGANGVSVNGTEISANVDNNTTAIVGGNITVKVGANLTTPNIGAATGTSLNLSGNVLAGNLNSNATITTVDLNATGNIIAANLTSNAFINAVDGNLTGNLTVGGNITTTGATGNISGANVIFANSFVSNGGLVDFYTNNPNVNLGNVANVHIYGGSTNQVLTTDGSGNLAWASGSQVANGYSNVSIPVANGNVYINANAGTDSQWIFNTDGTLKNPGAVFLNDQVVINSTGGEGGQVVLAYVGVNNLTGQGNSTWNIDVDSSNNFRIFTQYANSAAATPLTIYTANANVGISSNLKVDNTIGANTANISNNIVLGNTAVNWGTLTTVSIAANQTIAQLPVSGITGIEFLIKGIDSTGSKYSVATVQAVTDGANVDYSIYGGVYLTASTGVLAVNIVGSNIALQVTPSSTNSTVWTTQFRTI